MSVALEFKDFSFSYPGGRPVLDCVDWSIGEGSFALLIGKTGSGKTTLLKNAKPVVAPTGNLSGSVTVFGEDVASLDPVRSAQAIGYVAQSPDNQLICDTVWHEMAFGLENLGLPREEMRRRVAEVAHFFGIEPWFNKQVNQLSGGQKQLLNLASIMVMQPKVLLLDEPTAQLDPIAEKNFCHALFRLNRELGLTVVIATHAPQVMASYATSAFAMNQGRVEAADVSSMSSKLVIPSNVTLAKDVPVALSARDAFVRYDRKDDYVLRGADIQICKGSIHALVGGNGSGKTTLLKSFAGVLQPSRGRIDNSLKKRQAFLPQDPKTLFVCDSVEEELMEWSKPCGFGEAEVQQWLGSIGLSGMVDRHPYDLSGGQQQLLAFAKLALTDPDLLLLDEPTKGLDANSKLLLAKHMVQLAEKGRTIVVATHDLTFAACVAHRVSMLFDGGVTCTEDVSMFFQRNLFYRPLSDEFSDCWAVLDAVAGM